MGELFKSIAHAIREKEPIAVVTEVQGPNPGAKMLKPKGDTGHRKSPKERAKERKNKNKKKK